MPNPSRPGQSVALLRKLAAQRKGKKFPGEQRSSLKRHQGQEFRTLARKMLANPTYLKTVQKRLNDCTLHPSVHVALLYYAYDKPTEHVEQTQVVPVRIEHHFSKEADPRTDDHPPLEPGPVGGDAGD